MDIQLAKFKKTRLNQDFWVNALALAISSVPYGMGIEMGIWHWTFIQSFSSRLGGIPADLVLGGPYGTWRSIVLKKMGSGPSRSWLWNWFAGSLAFASFQIPIYLTIIFTTWFWVPIDKQATPNQILGACLTILVTAPIGDKLFEWCVKLIHSVKTKNEA